MKKFMKVMFFFAVLLFAGGTTTVLAAQNMENPPRLVDDADLLSDSEKEELSRRLDEISIRQKCDVVVVTVPDLAGSTSTAFADDYFDYQGYGAGEGRDGILLLIAMEDRDWAMSTHGSGITAFTDSGLSYIEEQFRPLLTDGEYAQAFDEFAGLCDQFLTQAATGRAYDSGNLPKEPFPVGRNVLISLGVGLIVAILIVGGMAGSLKSVRMQPAASGYVRKDSMNLTEQRELFLYSTMSRTAKPKESSGSSTHTSSSGSSHGGSSGKF